MSIRKNSLFISLGGGIRLLVNLAAIPLLIRLLGIDSYGVWVTINAQVGLFTLAEMGITTALLNRLPGFLVKKDETGASRCLGTSFLLIALFGLVASTVYYLISPLVATIYQGAILERGLLLSLRISSFIILPKLLVMYLTSIEAAHQRYDLQAIVDTLITVLLQAGVVMIAWRNGGISTLFLWLLFSSLAGVLAHSIIIKKILHVRLASLAISKVEAGCQWRFGLQHWVSSLGSSLFGQMDRILVNAILGSSASGVYAAVTSITIKINELSALPIKVITPAVSAEKENGNYNRIQSIYNNATITNGVIVLILSLPIIYWYDLLFRLVFTGNMLGIPSTILPFLACIYGTYSLAASGFYLLLGIGKPGVNAIWGFIGGTGMCLALILLSPIYGLQGAIWSNAVYILVVTTNFYGIKLIGANFSNYFIQILRVILILIIWTIAAASGYIAVLPIGIRLIIFILFSTVSICFAAGYARMKNFFHSIREHGLFFYINSEEIRVSQQERQ